MNLLLSRLAGVGAILLGIFLAICKIRVDAKKEAVNEIIARDSELIHIETVRAQEIKSSITTVSDADVVSRLSDYYRKDERVLMGRPDSP